MEHNLTLEPIVLHTDILIIGGGTAGCYAALTIAEHAKFEVIIAEKANIKRSGCLAAGVNALNAYIVKGQSPQTYLEYVKKDAEDIVREDLVYTMAQGLNRVTEKLEALGLVILKDEEGNYVARGNRNIKINGENIKPILAQAVTEQENIKILNRVNIIDYILRDGKVIGAYGFSTEKNIFYTIYAKATICATGGAAGLYKPNNPGFSRHKMWYSPFNTGAGYAMGIRAGAEMTTFEMRFIALRCKDTIAPTGTISQGVGAEQINSLAQEYEKDYGIPKTSIRLYATVMENQKGRGPCFLQTKGVSKKVEEDLYKAYLNMAPAQALKWIENKQGPSQADVEIEGTEPYIVGGHTASGYWIDTKRATTLPGLFAAGDVAGACPQKYVTGCFVEGEIAAFSAIESIKENIPLEMDQKDIEGRLYQLNVRLTAQTSLYSVAELEEAMQKIMDDYAGGMSSGYVVNEKKLAIATSKIEGLLGLVEDLKAKDLHELMFLYEVIDRLYVCKVLIEHLKARKETRWHSFHEYADYPQKDDVNWKKYVNSRYTNGKVEIIYRNLTKWDDNYEHQN